jgi:2-polyprenyl-3-methyl-5-hydroxy-6-metoxy-1,4-benzoquinol methylase
MKTKDALQQILNFARENNIKSILENERIFLRIIDKFGRRQTSSISTIEIARLLKKELDIGKGYIRTFLERKRRTWNKLYINALASGKPALLPWECQHPNPELVSLFYNKKIRPAKVLDIGCGTGINAIFMAKQGCRVTAIDVSGLALKIAKAKAKEANANCRFINKGLFELKLKKGGFDFIFDRGCFHHLPFFLHEAYKKTVVKWLKPGGIFHLICHGPKVFPLKYLYPYTGALTKVIDYFCEGNTESFFIDHEIRLIFSRPFKILEVNTISDPEGRHFEFLSCIMEKT